MLMISLCDLYRSEFPGSCQNYVRAKVWCFEAHARPQSRLSKQSQVRKFISFSLSDCLPNAFDTVPKSISESYSMLQCVNLGTTDVVEIKVHMKYPFIWALLLLLWLTAPAQWIYISISPLYRDLISFFDVCLLWLRQIVITSKSAE